MESFFVEFSEVFRTGEFSRLDALGKKYNAEMVDGWAEELMAKYNVKLIGQ